MAYFDAATIEVIREHEETEVEEGATPEMIAKAQEELGFDLQPSHVEFLGHFNGGVIVGSTRLFGVGRSDCLDLVTKRDEYEFVPPLPNE